MTPIWQITVNCCDKRHRRHPAKDEKNWFHHGRDLQSVLSYSAKCLNVHSADSSVTLQILLNVGEVFADSCVWCAASVVWRENVPVCGSHCVGCEMLPCVWCVAWDLVPTITRPSPMQSNQSWAWLQSNPVLCGENDFKVLRYKWSSPICFEMLELSCAGFRLSESCHAGVILDGTACRLGDPGQTDDVLGVLGDDRVVPIAVRILVS